MALLSDAQVDERLAAAPGWDRGEPGSIEKQWEFADFDQAIGFVDRVAGIAQAANHHPDILLHGWNKVKLSLTNHSAGGITEVDFTMAERFDALDG